MTEVEDTSGVEWSESASLAPYFDAAGGAAGVAMERARGEGEWADGGV